MSRYVRTLGLATTSESVVAAVRTNESVGFATRRAILDGMWLDGVEIPQELVSAHTDGNLVLFVGAGASVDKPSGLPTFRGLAKRLAEDSQMQPPPEGHALDKALGSLKRSEVDVHLKVWEIIGTSESEPNELHKAIARLALASPKPRIITTNYDRHLSKCLGNSLDEFPSMAFPQREDFTGIVYLHGSVREPAEHLVVTDADFGAVYLEAPWTVAQFLSRIFRSSTVLFIGYSHEDTLMEYLARSLPPESERFAFCIDTDKGKARWRDFGIQPVPYTTHEALPKLLQRWTERSRMGILDHERRIKTIVGGLPPLPQEDESYLDETIRSPIGLRLFTENARGVEWLRWIVDRPVFKRLFDPQAEYTYPDHLARWFADHLAMDLEASDEALATFQRHGGQFSLRLFPRMAESVRAALDSGGDEGGVEKTWLTLLVDQTPVNSTGHLLRILKKCDPVSAPHETLLLFDRSLKPIAALPQFSFGGNAMRLEPRLSGPSQLVNRLLGEYWQNTLRPGLADQNLAIEVAVIVDRHVRAAHRIAAATGEVEREWEGLSLARRAIEDHEQDRLSRHGGLGLLIDIARDTLEALLDHHPGHAEHYLTSWARSSAPIMRRLAIHGWTERNDVTPDEKIDWLRKSGWMFNPWLRHELMRLVATSLPQASLPCIDVLEEHVSAGPPEDTALKQMDEASRTEHSERLIFEWLEWMARYAPHAISVRQSLKTIQTKHSEWRPSDHPDFLIWSGEATWLTEQQLDPNELHTKLEEDPVSAFEELTCLPERNSVSEEMNRDERLNSLLATVQKFPADGIKIIDILIGDDRPADPTTRQRVAQSVFNAWTDAEIDDALRDAITSRLDRIWTTGTDEWTDGSRIVGSNVDWLTHAFNHWGGQIAKVLLRVINFEYQETGDGWAGLPEPLTTVMSRMIDGSNYASDLAQTILASRVSYLFAIDKQWCQNNVFPLLDPDTDEPRAVRCWDAYLAAGGTNEAMLEAGHLEHYLKMVNRLNDLSESNRRYFYQHLAEITLLFDMNSAEQCWLNRFTATADTVTRIRWIEAVTYELIEFPNDAADAQWNKWMRTYWENRLKSTPREMTNEEAAILASWAFCFDKRFSDAVNLACQHTAPIDQAENHLGWTLNSIPHQSNNTDHVEAYPEETAKLLAHILSSTNALPPQGESLLRYRIDEMVSALLNILDSPQSIPLQEQAVRLGITTSAD